MKVLVSSTEKKLLLFVGVLLFLYLERNNIADFVAGFQDGNAGRTEQRI